MQTLPTITASFGAAPLEAKAASAPAVSGVSAPQSWALEWGGLSTIAGPMVTPTSAMTVPVVKACVELIAGALGSLPVKVYREDSAGSRVEATDHPAFALVHDDANDFADAGQLREQLVTDALLHGNGFGLVRRDDAGEPIAVWRLPPEAVAIETDATTGAPFYRLTVVGGHEFIPSADMLHIAAPCTLDGITGVAPIRRARNAIALALAMEAHAARIFASGARPSGILSFPPQSHVDAKDAENALRHFKRQTAGENSGSPAVLFDGATWTALEFSTVDLQFAQMRTAQTHEITRAFSVPPTMIGELAKATLGNSETMARQFLRHTLMPWIRAFRSAYRRTLIHRDDRATYAIDFVLDGLLQADSAERASFYSAMRSAGVMTANDVRRLENLPAHKDGDRLDSPHVASPTATPRTPNPEAAPDV